MLNHLHDRIGRLERRKDCNQIKQKLHDRAGRLEIILNLFHK
ncbi:hypothetical protein AO373_0872 [Moraxella catarrhalis]|uniref:Uncharacterized protein n=1 Tax=Moraxella catarrhalis TaxID=480 RepID=A0AB36DQL8_MORCA|nr:hypothetical protein AO379_1877 [Moraxella catarrhalis]OAV18820.1 hypothetical protein AO373_0872 [Moraxella catarrhalis]OAV27040.1 hypothetical protein AO370_0381 [Moraxella catarrhalis]